ncbi:MAG: hypothetical protein ABI946_03210 [Chthoniobacterales bacterium]
MNKTVKNHVGRLIVSLCLIAASAGALALAAGSPEKGSAVRSRPPLPVASGPASCTPPGTTVVTDPAGDQTGAPTVNQQLDILSVSIAEPCFADGIDKLVFTFKVANLNSIPPNGHWKTQFVPPTLPTGITAFFVEMTSDQNGNVTYEYGNVGTTTTTLGTADDGSYNADGTITITVANSKVGNPVVGNTLMQIQGRTQLLVGAAGTGLLSTIDSTTVTGNNPSYTLVGHNSCSCPSPTPTPTPTPTPPGGTTGTPRYQNYNPPPTNSFNGGEPSIGVNWQTGNVMYLASFAAIRVGFDDCSSPARDTWTNTNAPSAVSLDPILFTDHMRAAGDLTPNRTFVSQLTGQDSITVFTDDDGASYLPSQGGGIPSGVDHQTIGAGPYHAPLVATPVYPNPIYYCSQDIAVSFCARSDDGGATFGPGVPIYNVTQCTGIHGHVKVAPDGTVYVPNRSCNGKAAVTVSADNGLTWTVKPIPTSSTTGFLVDPSVGIGANNVGKPTGQASNTVYLGYQAANSHPKVAVSHDQGDTWVNDQEVGTEFGLQSATFPELVAGDDNRAAYAFFGTMVPGNYTSQASFPPDAAWHLYIATSFDGGVTWTTVDATPNDPVQRGSICNLGTTSCMNTPNDRNLLDFMDETVDAQGRTIVGYPDGCVGPCIDGNVNSFTALASIARQSGGKRLFAANDPNPAEPVAPAAPRVDSVTKDGTGIVRVDWSAPDNGGSAIIIYHVFRRTDPGTYGAPLATVPASTTMYDDTTADPSVSYFYKVTAMNASGESGNCREFPITAPPPNNPCVGTGFLVDADPTGDQMLAPMNADLDIQAVLVGEPVQPDNINRLIFTMKVADLSTIPANRQFRIVWTPPTPPAMPGTDRYYVGMDTNTGGAGAATFDYGVVTSSGNVPISLGAADAGSVDPSGVIQIAIANNKVGNPAAGATFTLLSGRNFAGNGNATITKSSAIDSTADGSYTLIGNAACASAPVPVGAVSAKTHGSAGVFDIDLPLTGNPGIECRTGGTNGDHQIIVTFPAPVTIMSAMVSSGTGSVSSTTVNGSQVVVNLTGVANAQAITVTLVGVAMGSSFGNVSVPMDVLLGDVTLNRSVNGSDVSQAKSNSGQTTTEANFRNDVTANGAINSSDVGTIKQQSGTFIP